MRSRDHLRLGIAATTTTEIELFIPQRSLSLRSLESGFLMIAMIAAIAEKKLAIIWKPGLSYASLVNKIRFNNYNTSVRRKDVSCCSLIYVLIAGTKKVC